MSAARVLLFQEINEPPADVLVEKETHVVEGPTSRFSLSAANPSTERM
jgi:hypothetical protein